MMKDPRPARLANAEDTVLALHAEIERLRVREAAALKLAESYQVETERLTQERDLAKANADAVYAKLMPEVERLRAALEKFGSHDANCGFYDHRSLACDCGLAAARGDQQQPKMEK